MGHEIRVLSGNPLVPGPLIAPVGAVPRDPADPELLALQARLVRPLITALGLLVAWELLVWLTGVPPYILPPPSRVAVVLIDRRELLIEQAVWTAAEMILGLALGLLLGAALAVLFAASAGWRRWALPLVIVSQAVPVIAVAPLLVLWLGY
eukprot:gene6759-8617_t